MGNDYRIYQRVIICEIFEEISMKMSHFSWFLVIFSGSLNFFVLMFFGEDEQNRMSDLGL